MTNISRVRVAFTGFPGAPGVMTLYTLDTATFCDSLQTLLGFIMSWMPLDVTAQIETSGDVINDATGTLVDTWFSDPQAPITGAQGGAYAAPAGALIEWLTDQILDGRRLRGKNFVVPIAASLYETDGTLADANAATLLGGCNDFIAAQSSSFVIWHRPFAGSAAVGTRPARAAHAGGHGLVTACRVPDKVVVLRSRRD